MSATQKYCVAAEVGDAGLGDQYPRLLCYPDSLVPVRFDTIEEAVEWAQHLGKSCVIVNVEVAVEVRASYGAPALPQNTIQNGAWLLDSDAGLFRLRPDWRERIDKNAATDGSI